MTVEVVTEHQRARVSRFLVMVAATPDVPKIPRVSVPTVDRFTVFGDGETPADWEEVRKWAEDQRRGLDARGELGWVWIGHDQFFYHSEWQFFHCFGPDGWDSPQRSRSNASFAKVEAAEAAEKKAEREAARLKALANKGTKTKKKTARDVDSIASDE